MKQKLNEVTKSCSDPPLSVILVCICTMLNHLFQKKNSDHCLPYLWGQEILWAFPLPCISSFCNVFPGQPYFQVPHSPSWQLRLFKGQVKFQVFSLEGSTGRGPGGQVLKHISSEPTETLANSLNFNSCLSCWSSENQFKFCFNYTFSKSNSRDDCAICKKLFLLSHLYRLCS